MEICSIAVKSIKNIKNMYLYSYCKNQKTKLSFIINSLFLVLNVRYRYCMHNINLRELI